MKLQEAPTMDELLAHASWMQRLARSLVQDAASADDLVHWNWPFCC